MTTMTDLRQFRVAAEWETPLREVLASQRDAFKRLVAETSPDDEHAERWHTLAAAATEALDGIPNLSASPELSSVLGNYMGIQDEFGMYGDDDAERRVACIRALRSIEALN
jgi:hypothetical protein